MTNAERRERLEQLLEQHPGPRDAEQMFRLVVRAGYGVEEVVAYVPECGVIIVGV